MNVISTTLSARSSFRHRGIFAILVALLISSFNLTHAVEIDGKSTFSVGKFVFQIGGDAGSGEAWLVGVVPGVELQGEITIPGSATINGTKYTVTRIGSAISTDNMWWYDYEAAIHDQPGITRLVIPSTIKEIITFEFMGCTGIAEFHVNAANTEFKDENGVLFRRADYDDWELFRMPPATKKTKYTIPKGTVNVCNNAFADNKTIKTLILAGNMLFAQFCMNRNLGITEIDVTAADFYENLEGVIYYAPTWNINGETIGKYGGIVVCPPALKKETLTLPASVKYIRSGAFCSTNIFEVVFPESLSEFGWFVFYNSKLTTLRLNADNIVDQDASFDGLCLDCNSLTSVELSGSSKAELTISDNMFRGCGNLSSLVISSDKVNLKTHAFYGCRSLTSFPFAKLASVTGYNMDGKGYQFAYSGLVSARIPSFCRYVPEGMFMGSALSSVNLNPSGKNNLRVIYPYAFKDCQLEEVNLAHVQELNDECFAGNPLKKVVFPDNPYFDEFELNSVLVDRAFTPTEETWFYLGDNAVHWVCSYDWATGMDDLGLYRATYVSSHRKCFNVPSNFKTVYGPAGCHNVNIGWAQTGVGEVKEMFTMVPVEDRLAVLVEQSAESSNLSFEMNSMEINELPAVRSGNVWSIDGEGNVNNCDRQVAFTVDGVAMETFYPMGYLTGLQSVERDVRNAEIRGIYGLDGRSLGTNSQELPGGIYIVAYSDGTTEKIFRRGSY